MIGERTTEGWEIRLRPRGVGRFFTAAFLGAWLCGWAIGEAFVIWIVVRGAYALITGEPPRPGHEPLTPGPAMMIGAFLLFWLLMWTVGGVAAINELLSMLWGEDRLTAQGGGFRVTYSRGPFRLTREFARPGIRQVVVLPRSGHLALRTERETVELSRLGTSAERLEVATTLRSQLGLSAEAAEPTATLPAGWEETVTPEGERAVVTEAGVRVSQARFAAIVTAAFALILLELVRETLDGRALVGPAILIAAITAGSAWAALWLARGRVEWRIGTGRLTLWRRFGSGARQLFEARRLDLWTSSDSDGDDWFRLDGVAAGAESAPPPSSAISWDFRARKVRRPIASAMNDSTMPRQLGAWLARAADIPLEDRATHNARTAQRPTPTVPLSGNFR